MKNLKSFVFWVVILLLTACGRDFVRPQAGEIVLGKTTKSELLTTLGEPEKAKSVKVNSLPMENIYYQFKHGAAFIGQVHRQRALTYTLHNDIVVAYVFLSTFDDDSTNFDEEKVKYIQAGITTKQDVIQLMGPPSGEAIYPVVSNRSLHAFQYAYQQSRHIIGGARTNTKRTLRLMFDPKDVVVNVNFSGDE